jgi:transaldolase/glucose-6-phosphate isomerase
MKTAELNKVAEISKKFGQSIWLDYIRRHLLESGELSRLIAEDGISGVTSNPSILEKAIAGSTDYDEDLKEFESRGDHDAAEIYEHLAIADIRRAADILRPVYTAEDGRDGFVSLEVSPYLAADTAGTVAEARRLWKAVDRANLMIKVPATPEGLPAIRMLIAEGINVNVTLLFSRDVYRQVAEAYMAGLEERAKAGASLRGVASVASFFVSRIDTAVGKIIEDRMTRASASEKEALEALAGKAAIANAKMAYQDWKGFCAGGRWRALQALGARPQRLLWASTSAKDPRFRDVVYVESLIGPETVDTVPPATLDAFRSHGVAAKRLESGIEEARGALQELEKRGISMEQATRQLLVEGLRAFSSSFDALMASIEKKRDAVLRSDQDRMALRMPASLEKGFQAALEDWRSGGKIRRLWARDASLWTGQDEAKWLDWLNIPGKEESTGADLSDFAEQVRARSFSHAVVLGMGGSSLCPEVLSEIFKPAQGFPRLLVLDSTDPSQIKSLETRIDPRRTLFIVSSKSGSTIEPNILMDYFFGRVASLVGPAEAPARFIAITDPGSALERTAKAKGFWRVFLGEPGIGGRYSALSHFGMVPAAVMGLDVAGFLDRAARMVHACASCVPPQQNPGVLLGILLGTAAGAGMDKVTIVASPAIEPLGAWLEQLLAESSGKIGKGLIPVDAEPLLGAPERYGGDRLFAYLKAEWAPDPAQDKAIAALEAAGRPVARIAVAEAMDLGQEFFRWEIAIAVACAVIGVNAFNQPDVEASKVKARSLTDAYEKSGSFPAEAPFFQAGALSFFASKEHGAILARAADGRQDSASILAAHLGLLRLGDYFGLLAYIERSDDNRRRLQDIRRLVLERYGAATCLGFGPRFLHSTGQAYKGGPNSGVFLELTCDDPVDLDIPGRRLSFGVVKAAQALGDLDVLASKKRRALRVHLGPDVSSGLSELARAIERGVAPKERGQARA